MLHATRKSDRKTVPASVELDPTDVFYCPQCGERVILRTAKNRKSHFAHKVFVNCDYTVGETNAHRACKVAIAQGLLKTPGISEVALERPFGVARPDVSAVINGVRVAIEVQISSLSMELIARRTSEYAQIGMPVLWLCQWTPELDAVRYSPSLWEKWLHAAYFGRVYYWMDGLSVAAYRFDPYVRRVPARTWYSRDGKPKQGGGYNRMSERYRIPVRERTLNLASDFKPMKREWWRGGRFTIPSATLFMENNAP
jgi:competence protein CoiA